MNLTRLIKPTALALSCALSACATAVPDVKTEIANQRFLAQKGLPAQKLDRGACAMFLWGAGQGRPLQFFQDASLGDARLAISPEKLATRISGTAPVVEGLFAKQTFELDGLDISVVVKPANSRNVLKGIPIPTGRMVVREADGRETILPVAGLFGCRN